MFAGGNTLPTGPCGHNRSRYHHWKIRRDGVICAFCSTDFITWAAQEIAALRDGLFDLGTRWATGKLRGPEEAARG